MPTNTLDRIKKQMEQPCECERGPVAYRIVVTKVDGELCDSASFCRECMGERAVKSALESLGLQP